MDDLTNLIADLLHASADSLTGRTFNVARENHIFSRLATIVCDVVQQEIPEVGQMSWRPRTPNGQSHNLLADRIQKVLGWRPSKTVEDAVVELSRPFRDGKLPDAMSDPRYYNVKMIQAVGLV